MVLLPLQFFAFQTNLAAQSFCGVAGGGNQIGALPPGECFTDYPGPYFVKIYVHVVREDDGNGGFSGGQTDAAVRNAFAILESDFAPHNIFFVRSCEAIDAVVSPSEYNSFDAYCNLWSDPNYQYADGIALFLGPPHSLSGSAVGGGLTNGIPCNKIWVAGLWPGFGNAVESPVISHEMGHALGLYHPEHGTISEGGPICGTFAIDPNSCCEMVEDFNSTDPASSGCTCGDYVPDTAADIGTATTGSTCAWVPPSSTPPSNCIQGSFPNYLDGNDDPYAPGATNIMSNNPTLACRTALTSGQGRRMRYLLETEQILQNSTNNPQMTNPEITTNTYWTTTNTPNNGDFLVDGNLTIKSGSFLSIQSGVTVHFGEDSKVIIEPNAQLELRGTLTSNSCGEFWQGVEVWGDSGQPQWPVSAFPVLYPQGYFRGWYGGVIENAVTAVQLSGPTGNGGVISCTGTTIRNSVKGIVFEPHQNFLAPFNIPFGYLGTMQNSIFEVDGDYPHQTPFHSFIQMTGVNGPRISHCSFTNDIVYSIFIPTDAEDHGYGIFADGAGFTLNNSSEFHTLGYGVYVGASGSQFPFVVEDCTFEQCIVGIRNRGVHGATILSNIFNMGVKPNLYFGDQFGITFEEGITSFTCQENSFINTAGNNYHDLIGIFCKNTGDFSKTIRRNNFVGLDFGNLSNGTNGGGSLQLPRGLNYLCNTNSNVASDGFDFDVADGQIRPVQGLPNSSATGGHDATGNTFSYTGTDFNNMGGNIRYFYDPFSTNQTPITYSSNVGLNTGDENMCPSDFIERPPLDTQIVDNIKQQYHDTKEAYSELMPTYQSHPTDAMANTLSLYRQEMDEAAYKIALHIKSDTLSPYYPDSLYAWIGNLENYEGDLWLAREYLAAGSPTLAAQVVNSIPSKYTLTTAQQSDLNNYAAIAGFIGTTSVYELDATTLTALRSYDNVGGHAEGWAQNILTWYGAHYSVEYTTSSQSGQQLIKDGQIGIQPHIVPDYKVAVFPNPADSEVNFSLTGNIPQGENELLVRDIYGRLVAKLAIGDYGSITWDSSNTPSGIYFYQFLINGKPHEGGKIILDR